MGLEHTDYLTLGAHMRQALKRGAYLGRVVRVIAEYYRPPHGADALQPPFCAGEGQKPRGDFFCRYAAEVGHRRGSQRVVNIVQTEHRQRGVAKKHVALHYVKAAVSVFPDNIGCPEGCLGTSDSEGYCLHSGADYYLAYIFVVGIGDKQSVGRGNPGKRYKRVLYLLDSRKIVEVFGLDVEHHRNTGIEVQEGIHILAGLKNKISGPAYPVGSVH